MVIVKKTIVILADEQTDTLDSISGQKLINILNIMSLHIQNIEI